MRVKYFSLLFIALAAACSDGRDAEMTEQSSDWSRAEVARYAGGVITMAEAVSQAARDRQSGRALPQCAGNAASLDDTVACYRETARDLALGRLLQARGLGSIEAEGTLAARRSTQYGRLHLQHLAAGIEISEAAARARFEADADRFVQPASVLLWNIMRRHEDPSRPELTDALLREIRQRVLAGETFAELAREYSQSETRLRGGLVGRVAQGGRLAPELERAAFALEPGEVSEPIAVPGGAVLLQISEKTAAVTYPFAEVQERIEAQLREERVLEVATDRVNELEPPPGSVILTEEALFTALAAGGETVLLQVGDSRLMASGMGLGPDTDLSDPEIRAAVLEAYQGRVRLALLAVMVGQSEEAWAVKIREDVKAQLESLQPLLVIENWVRQSIATLLEREPVRLESYFRDNRAHYQTPLRFDIVALDLPLEDAPHQRLLTLERLVESGIAGRAPLDRIAADNGGEVTDHGWVEFESLPALFSSKGVSLINQTEVGRLVPPYQDDNALHLLWIRGREEPRLQEYEAVRDRVRDDYTQRFGKQVSAELREEFLAEAGFGFDEVAVRRLLSD